MLEQINSNVRTRKNSNLQFKMISPKNGVVFVQVCEFQAKSFRGISSALSALVVTLLFVGIRKQNHYFLLPHLVCQVLSFILLVLYTVVTTVRSFMAELEN